MQKEENNKMAKIKFTGPEKRAHLRVSSRCGLKYTRLSKNLRRIVSAITKSQTEDICAGGIKFVAYKKLPLHAILEFQFKIPDTARYAAGFGEVVRIKSRIGGKSYDVGLKFLWITRKNAELTDAYVRKKRIQEIIKKLRKK
ncbi:MAG: hypothetical protein A3I73_03100 [Omnitrophica bacterium RIFCSPLOWO2_02_FULL_45_16]|nr:MAG: hypothetical protein A3C51_03760 [Omnitrophica bacterium RIFCSPHIGHO2_02_FULL_46_20]OGX00327.1 MAG: hypothetical protein A3I73_03100 [Omnitrophica bacterium RIFCSPLOWO2_02_FULL_45_16]